MPFLHVCMYCRRRISDVLSVCISCGMCKSAYDHFSQVKVSGSGVFMSGCICHKLVDAKIEGSKCLPAADGTNPEASDIVGPKPVQRENVTCPKEADLQRMVGFV